MSASILNIPKDIIKQYIITNLYGKHVRSLLTSCKRMYSLYTLKERLVLEFGSRNMSKPVPKQKPPHNLKKKDQDLIPCIYCDHDVNEYGYENHLSRCSFNPNIRGKIRCRCIHKNLQYNNNSQQHYRSCPLYTVTCTICNTTGCLGDIMPWKLNQVSHPLFKCDKCGKQHFDLYGCISCNVIRHKYKQCDYCDEDISCDDKHLCKRSIPRWINMLCTTLSPFNTLDFDRCNMSVSKQHKYWQINSSYTGRKKYIIIWIPINAADARNDKLIGYIMQSHNLKDTVFIVKGEATEISDTSCILYFNMGKGWIKN